MRRKTVFGIIVLVSITLVSGCSFKIPKNIAELNPFQKPSESISEKSSENKVKPVKPVDQVIDEVNAKVNKMVVEINSGRWENAIGLGLEGHNLLVTEPSFKEAVKNSVYLTQTVRENLYETLVEAYDFKLNLEGLSKEEINKYVEASRAHLEINPAEPFKKLALAKVLIDTGNIADGLRLATEVNNLPIKNKDTMETYAWGVYVSGKKLEAYEMYKNLFAQSETLLQQYHAAVVIEEYDKTLGLKLYQNCLNAGNNLMVKEENLRNQSAQSYINSIMVKSQQATDRLLAGGSGVDSQFRVDASQNIVQAIVKL